jgi:hypothetical protein
MDDIVYVPSEGDSSDRLAEKMRESVINHLKEIGKACFLTKDVDPAFLTDLGNGMLGYTPEKVAEYSKSKFGKVFTTEIICCTDNTNQHYSSTVEIDHAFCMSNKIKVIIVYENDISKICVQPNDIQKKYVDGINDIIV